MKMNPPDLMVDNAICFMTYLENSGICIRYKAVNHTLKVLLTHFSQA